MKGFAFFMFAIIGSLVAVPFVFAYNVVAYMFKGKLGEYFMALAIAIDQAAASLLYGRDAEDWTISSYSYLRCAYYGTDCKWVKFINALLWFDKDHCKNSYEYERKVLKREEGEK